MTDIKTSICMTVSEYVTSRGGDFPADKLLPLVEVPSDRKRGDLALPCFRLAGVLRTNPNAIAQSLAPLFDGSGFDFNGAFEASCCAIASAERTDRSSLTIFSARYSIASASGAARIARA